MRLRCELLILRGRLIQIHVLRGVVLKTLIKPIKENFLGNVIGGKLHQPGFIQKGLSYRELLGLDILW